MGVCGEQHTTDTIETTSWSAEGHWPDTAEPPDEHTVETVPVWDVDTCTPPLCPAGTFQIVIPEEPYENTYTSTVTKKWYEIDPQTHFKTYHVKKTKTTEVVTGQNFHFVCFDPRLIDLIKKEFPNFLKDEFGIDDARAVGAYVE
jgi:hypothetical protein